MLVDMAESIVDVTRRYTLSRTEEIHLRSNLRLTSSSGDGGIIAEGITDDDFSNFDGGRKIAVPPAASNVEIDHLSFLGQHISGWTNAQHAMIRLGANVSNINIHHNHFQDLVGFVLSGLERGNGLNFHNNDVANCGNGINFDIDNATVTDNTITNSEGFEVLGDNLYMARNDVSGALVVAFSIGGDVNGGHFSGAVIEDNYINGSNNVGIMTADGIDSAVLQRNTVAGCNVGILSQLSSGFEMTAGNILWSENTVSGCTIGMYFPYYEDRLTGIVIDANVVRMCGSYGLLNANPNTTILRNDFKSGSATDVLLQPSSATCVFAESGDNANLYDSIVDAR